MPDAETTRYRVMLLNDDETPMEFVVHVLEEFFGMTSEQAMRLMLSIHNKGVGECGSFPRALAEQKVADVGALARERKFPLQCVMEKVA